MDYTLAHVLSMADGTDHAAPTTPPSIAEAHEDMREHVDCVASRCPRKGKALDILIQEGRIRPDYDRMDK